MAAAHFLPEQLELKHISEHCDQTLSDTKTEIAETYCVNWLGSKGSRRQRSPSRLDYTHDSLPTSKTLRFRFNYKEYSPRTVAFLLVRPREVHENNIHRLHLKSKCHNPYCINPWHHEATRAKSRRQKMHSVRPGINQPMDRFCDQHLTVVQTPSQSI